MTCSVWAARVQYVRDAFGWILNVVTSGVCYRATSRNATYVCALLCSFSSTNLLFFLMSNRRRRRHPPAQTARSPPRKLPSSD